MTPSDIVKLKHPEWTEHQLRWRWLADSLEGGDRYRWAVYGQDRRSMPVRNLIRHKREYPPPGEQDTYVSVPSSRVGIFGGPQVDATDDDYTLRLIRTPVPDLVSEVIGKHLGRVYRHEVRRQGPAQYLTWIEDVNGSGTPLDAWMRRQLAPQLLAIGCLDVVIDHPRPPAGSRVQTRADVQALSLDSVIARIIPPWDVMWWQLDATGRYERVLVHEMVEGVKGDPESRYRLWSKTEWVLMKPNGEVIEQAPHPYGVVPQIRCFVGRKYRCPHTGWTPIESVAERQREFYNRDSELVLSDVLQAHPMLQGPPPDADGTIALGPGWLLAKRREMSGPSVSYEGYDYIDPPKGAADSIRTNLDRIRDQIDRSQGLNKPAGSDAGGSSAGVVAQSGLSKSYDHQDRNDLLNNLADALQVVEVDLGRMAMLVATDGTDDGRDSIIVTYSRKFDLKSGDELAASLAAFQDVLASAGRAPELEIRVLMAIVRDELLPGLEDNEYAEIEDEIRMAIEESSTERKAGVMNAMAAATGVDSSINDPSANDPMGDPNAVAAQSQQ